MFLEYSAEWISHPYLLEPWTWTNKLSAYDTVFMFILFLTIKLCMIENVHFNSEISLHFCRQLEVTQDETALRLFVCFLRERDLLHTVIFITHGTIVKFLPPANEVWAKVLFSQTSVCPPWRGVLWCHFLLWTATPGQHHPPPESTSGRYASYWNAFLFKK